MAAKIVAKLSVLQDFVIYILFEGQPNSFLTLHRFHLCFYSGTQAAVVNNDIGFLFCLLVVSVDKGYHFCNIEDIMFEITNENEIHR